jgi:hypothetical protein
MAKITLDSVASGYDLSKINSNFVTIAAALNDEVLYRDNPVGEVNTLLTEVDANSQSIYNIPTPTLDHEIANKAYVDDSVGDAPVQAAAAAASAAAALVSENNAETAETNAEAAAVLAAASAAALPNAATAGADKFIQVNGTATGWDYLTAGQTLIEIGAAASGHTHTGVYEPANANLLETTDIGTSVQAYDVDTAKLDVDQSWTGAQRGTVTADNDLSFDLSVTNNFSCTPSAGGTLTFTNHTAGQSGMILLTNGANYAIAAAATTKIHATDLATISATGVWLLCYFDNGTNAYVTVSRDLT